MFTGNHELELVIVPVRLRSVSLTISVNGYTVTCPIGLKLSLLVVNNLSLQKLCLVYPRALLWVPCYYIDDVTRQISPSSLISLFADDIALYRCIRSPADFAILQTDITNIAILVEEKLCLKFNTDKCSVLFISRKCSLSVTPRPLFIKTGSPLKQVNSWCCVNVKPVMVRTHHPSKQQSEKTNWTTLQAVPQLQ